MTESLGKYITTISKYINYYINKRANKLNLNIHQVHILKILYNNEGINQEELTDISKSDKVTISKLLDGLVKEEYVEKRKNEEDRRIKNLYVTEKGESIKKEIKNILKDTTKILSADFTEKENVIIRKLLNRMLDNIYDEINNK
ncbi:MarR family winged helix-turn-helix transcriptional regulator [Halanaerobium sp. ST460_2HS_T2]|uniref:MarR family winged helix-turn-helix transcriptional regulator n=1 Tax=Halanaerobium sp. ST460_2HS_T2 TaxID=2183914 RepID=UPI000DF2CD9F|nr:MarR family transcriptional regulator [Halanaerobium sp. ST460_2HS_T2]RCW51618.1 MarR family transcriptional regulator [Halanaerobium sp. ST460_2HS_T2]